MKHQNVDEAITDEALAWRMKLEQDDADWEAYTVWLEADSRHRVAYNTLDLLDAAVSEHREEVARLLRPSPPVRRIGGRLPRAMSLLGGAAAALALLVALPMVREDTPTRRFEATSAAGRLIILADGVRVTLSPASSIVVRGEDAARIELTKGEAFFDVRHDPSRILTVSAGDYSISDIGTRFSVNVASNTFRLGVSQGTVAISSEGTRPIEVTAGRQLLASGSRLTLSPVAVMDVGSWRAGRLSYSDAPLSMVAADISRYSGRPVSIDPSLEETHFSGSLAIGDRSRLLEDLATVVGAEVRREADRDRISAGRR